MARESKKRRGIEWRAAGWLLRHPGVVALPVVVVTGLVTLGWQLTAGIAGGLVLLLVAWRRGAPDSFDRYAAVGLRSIKRRWIDYSGKRWNDVFDACGLIRENRKKGYTETPRLLRVRSYTPTIDVLTIRMVRGQSLRKYENVVEELAQSLDAESLCVLPIKRQPKKLKLAVVRKPPFEEPVEATEPPEHSAALNPDSVPIREDKYGETATIPIRGQQTLAGAASGSGMSSLIWTPLRALGPAIHDGLVDLSGIDGRGGMELEQGRDLFAGGLATSDDEFVPALERFRDELRHRKQDLAAQGKRSNPTSVEYPHKILVIDELGMLTAYGDNARTVNQLLGEITTQGRALGFTIMAYVQDPSKDVVAVRDLFTYRLALRLTTANQVDMVLGDGMRAKGALADLIYPDESTAGIGFQRAEK